MAGRAGSIPDTMRAVILNGHGGLDKLEYVTDFPKPGAGIGKLVVMPDRHYAPAR